MWYYFDCTVQYISNNSVIYQKFLMISCDLDNFLRTKFMGSRGKIHPVTRDKWRRTRDNQESVTSGKWLAGGWYTKWQAGGWCVKSKFTFYKWQVKEVDWFDKWQLASRKLVWQVTSWLVFGGHPHNKQHNPRRFKRSCKQLNDAPSTVYVFDIKLVKDGRTGHSRLNPTR